MDDLKSVSEVATELDMQKLEVNRRIRRGQIKARKVGYFWVVEAGEVQRVKKTQWYAASQARKQAQAATSE